MFYSEGVGACRKGNGARKPYMKNISDVWHSISNLGYYFVAFERSQGFPCLSSPEPPYHSFRTLYTRLRDTTEWTWTRHATISMNLGRGGSLDEL